MGISQNIQKSHDLDYRVNNEEKNLTTVLFNILHHINYFIFFSDSRNGSVIKYLRNKIIYYVRTTSFVFKLYITKVYNKSIIS